MRKLIMSMSVLAGLFFAGTIPASANAAAGLTAMQAPKAESAVTDVRWRHHGWRRGWGGGGIYLGLPFYGYGYYPRYRYYDGYYPSYYYGGYGRRWHYRHHHRHYRHHWRHRRW